MKYRQGIIAVLALAVVATGCAGSDSDTDEGASPTTRVEAITPGGTLVLGASQQPNCADWYAPCGSSSWGLDMMGRQTMPRAFDYVDYEHRPSALLAGEPTLEIGPPQKVTFRIDPRAVWSDGQPITSRDIRFSVDTARASGTLTAPPTGVEEIDPRTVVVMWSEPAPGWRDQFTRILPAHLLEGKDRTAEMRDGYKWSGGPWIIDRWIKDQELRLVPNPRYWGQRPHLDAVVFKIIPDAAAYLAAQKTGQVDMIFVQGAQPEVLELKGLPDTSFQVERGLTHEFITLNTAKPPLDSRAVRQALAHASDREAIVTQLSGALVPGINPAQAFMSPANRKWYSEPFGRYRRDLTKVNQLMTGAVLVLTLPLATGWSRYVRASMLDVLSAPYIRMARAKGLPRRRVLARHALRNALIPFSTVSAVAIGHLFGGVIVTESIFGWPGMGQLFFNALLAGDTNVVLPWLMVAASFVLVLVLISDIVLGVLDPRVRVS